MVPCCTALLALKSLEGACYLSPAVTSLGLLLPSWTCPKTLPGWSYWQVIFAPNSLSPESALGGAGPLGVFAYLDPNDRMAAFRTQVCPMWSTNSHIQNFTC